MIFTLSEKMQLFSPIAILGVLRPSILSSKSRWSPRGFTGGLGRPKARTRRLSPFLSLVQLPSSFHGDLLSEIHPYTNSTQRLGLRVVSSHYCILEMKAFITFSVIKQSYHDQARSSSIILSTKFGIVPDQRITNLPSA